MTDCLRCQELQAKIDELEAELDEKVWVLDVKTESGEEVTSVELDWFEHGQLLGLGLKKLLLDVLEEVSGVTREEAQGEEPETPPVQ